MKKEDLFKLRKEIAILERDTVELKHKYKMEEIEAEAKSSRLFHERELERIRIKSAEVRRTQERANFLR